MIQPDHPLRGADIRKQNERLVLNLFYDTGRLSQSEAVTKTGLKPSTVLRIFTTLQEVGDILQCDPSIPEIEKRGRRPVFYRINPNAHYVLGLGLNARGISLLIMDFGLNICFQKETEFPANIDATYVLEIVRELISNAIECAKIEKDRILGIGISVPGVSDMYSRKISYYPYIKDISQVDFQAELEKVFSFPVFMNSNISSLVSHEFRYGLGVNSTSLLLIALDDDVDAAYFAAETAYSEQNAQLTMLRVGHTSVNHGDRYCICGDQGCLEAYLSNSAMLDDFKQIAGIDEFSEISEEIVRGNQAAYQLFNRKADILSECLTNLNIMLTPATIVIICSDEKLANMFAERYKENLKKVIARKSFAPVIKNIPEVIPAKFNRNTIARRAADLVYDAFFATPLLPWTRPKILS